MQHIELADHLFPALLLGHMTSTIQLGHRRLPLGALTFTASGIPSVSCQVEVERVVFTQVSALTHADALRYGAPNPAIAAQRLRRHHPEMGPHSRITVIEFVAPDLDSAQTREAFVSLACDPEPA